MTSPMPSGRSAGADGYCSDKTGAPELWLMPRAVCIPHFGHATARSESWFPQLPQYGIELFPRCHALRRLACSPMPFCPYCGHEVSAEAASCPECGHPFVRPPTEPDAMTRMLLPVGRSGWAIAAGYLALFGLVIFPLAFIGLVLGFVAIRDIRRHPHLHGMGRAV